MAAAKLQDLLGEDFKPEKRRSTESELGSQGLDQADGDRESVLGRTSRAWELLKLGIEISERTVSRLMPKNKKPPSQNWRAFLNNHVQDLVSVDFFTVPTVSFRVLFVFVVLAHHRRRIVHFNVTEHPTAGSTGQQMVEAFPEDTVPRYLLRDRDKIYGYDFRERIQGMSIEEALSVPAFAYPPRLAETVRLLDRWSDRGSHITRVSAQKPLISDRVILVTSAPARLKKNTDQECREYARRCDLRMRVHEVVRKSNGGNDMEHILMMTGTKAGVHTYRAWSNRKTDELT